MWNAGASPRRAPYPWRAPFAQQGWNELRYGPQRARYAPAWAGAGYPTVPPPTPTTLPDAAASSARELTDSYTSDQSQQHAQDAYTAVSAGSPIAQSIADNLNLLPGVFQPPAPPSWSNLQVGRFSRYAQGASYAFYNEQAAQHRPLITQLRDPLAAAAIARQSPSLDRQAAAVVGAVIRNGGPTGAAVRGSTVT